MFMQVGQIPKIYLGKAETLQHEVRERDMEKLTIETVSAFLGTAKMVVELAKINQKTELKNEIETFKNLFHPAGKMSKVRHMKDEDVLKFAQKIVENDYEAIKYNAREAKLKSKNIKDITDSESGAHTHEVIKVTTKFYRDTKEKAEGQIKFLIDDIDGM